MKQIRTLIIISCLCCSNIVYSQPQGQCYPLSGFSEKQEYLFRLPDGWLMISKIYQSNQLSHHRATLSRLDNSNKIKWQRSITTPGISDYFNLHIAQLLPDGRILLAGSIENCISSTELNTCYLLTSEGDIIWQYMDKLPIIAGFYVSGLAPEPAYNKLVMSVSTGEATYYLFFQLDSGKLLKLTTTELPSRVLPAYGNAGYYVLQDSVIQLVKDDTVIQNLYLPENIYHNTVYHFQHQSLFAILKTDEVILTDTGGHTEKLPIQQAWCLDMNDSNQLAVLSYIFNPNPVYYLYLYNRKDNIWEIQYSWLLSQLSNHNITIKNIVWNGSQLLLSGDQKSGVPAYQIQNSLFYKNKVSNYHQFICVFDPVSGNMSLPYSDAMLTDIQFGKNTWWHYIDTTSTILYKARDITVTLQNNGIDTLKSVTVCAANFKPHDVACYRDSSFYRRFDGLRILPGAKQTISIDEMILSATYNYEDNDSIYFWVTLPNEHFDSNWSDNTFAAQIQEPPVIQPGTFRVFPNPVQDQLMISLDETIFTYARFQLVSVTGRVIRDVLLEHVGGYYILDTKELMPGFYFLKSGNVATKICKAPR